MSKHPIEPKPQFDPGAHVYMREAIEELRRCRDEKIDRAELLALVNSERLELPKDGDLRRLVLVAHNLRDAFEWLWPLLWTDDPEFVPFEQRKRHIAGTIPMRSPQPAL